MTAEYTLEQLDTLAAMVGYKYDSVLWSSAGFTVVLEDSSGGELTFTGGTADVRASRHPPRAGSEVNSWDSIGILLAAGHAAMALLVVLSLPEATRRGSGGAGTLYTVLAIATVVWIVRSALWQQ